MLVVGLCGRSKNTQVLHSCEGCVPHLKAQHPSCEILRLNLHAASMHLLAWMCGTRIHTGACTQFTVYTPTHHKLHF